MITIFYIECTCILYIDNFNAVMIKPPTPPHPKLTMHQAFIILLRNMSGCLTEHYNVLDFTLYPLIQIYPPGIVSRELPVPRYILIELKHLSLYMYILPELPGTSNILNSIQFNSVYLPIKGPQGATGKLYIDE